MSESQPYFTVIIPSYNRARIIHKTLNSVFAQSFRDFEVIVVDNCSTDNTAEVLQPLVDKGKLRFIQHDKNYERAKSRNTGMINAHGRFVTFLDSDDLMYPNNLQDAYEFSQANPETLFFHNLFEIVDENNNLVKQYHGKPMTDPLKNIATGNFLACIGVFVHESIAAKVRFDETPELTGSEDWEFWIRVMAEHPQVGRILKVNSAMVEHSGRTVNNIDIFALINRRQYILEKVKQDAKLSNVYGPYLNYMQASSDLMVASNASSVGEYALALQHIRKAIKAHPEFLIDPRFAIATKNALKGKLFDRNAKSA